MSELLNVTNQVQLHAATCYPRSNNEALQMGLNGSRNTEMRAMTIAAFRVAQNNNQLSEYPMNAQLVSFLVANSDTAINHWKKTSRLLEVDGKYVLTPQGITECQNTLLGMSGAYSTTEEKVVEWVTRMLYGDQTASASKKFDASVWG